MWTPPRSFSVAGQWFCSEVLREQGRVGLWLGGTSIGGTSIGGSYADAGPAGELGELLQAAAAALGISTSPASGGGLWCHFYRRYR